MSLRLTDNHTELSFNYMRVEGKQENLLDFLLRRFRYLNEQEWLDNIRAKLLLVDGRVGKPNQRMKDHQKITYLRPDFLEPEVDTDFEMVYEDEAVIALNKPGNLPTSPSGKYYKNTLVNLVKKQYGWKKLYPLHRLDRETSGVIIFGKNRDMAQAMSNNFRLQRVRKIYTALLEAPLPHNDVFIALPIGLRRGCSIRIKQGVSPGGKHCRTHFREIGHIMGFSKVEIRPYTGRTHQIRVHAEHLGCPVVGDKLYGLPEEGFLRWLKEGDVYLRRIGFPAYRQMLHAQEISFHHPLLDREFTIHADDGKMLKDLRTASLPASP